MTVKIGDDDLIRVVCFLDKFFIIVIILPQNLNQVNK